MDEYHQSNLVLDKLRFRLGSSNLDISQYDDENGFNLSRWLNAYDNDVDKIVPKLHETLEFRKALKLRESAESIDNGEFRKKFNTDMVEYFPGGPGGVCGYDNNGNVVYIQPCGLTDPKDALPLVRYSEFLTWVTMEVEAVFRMVLKKEWELKKKCGIIIIFDLQHLAMHHLSIPAVNIFRSMMCSLQPHYPDLVSKMYVVNTPILMNLLIRLVSPFVSKHNWSKVEFLTDGGDESTTWRQKLKTKLGAAGILPIHWGGTRMGKFGDLGDVVISKLPQNLSAKHHTYPKDTLSQLDVSRGSVATVRFSLKNKSAVRWYFTCSSGGIVFGLKKLKEKGEDVWITPKWLVHTDFVPEYGSCDLEPADYDMIFDNTCSKLWNRKVSYLLTLKPIV